MNKNLKKSQSIRDQWSQHSEKKTHLKEFPNTLKCSLARGVLHHHSPSRTPLPTVLSSSCSNQETRLGLNNWQPVHEERYINRKVSWERWQILPWMSSYVCSERKKIISNEIKIQISPFCIPDIISVPEIYIQMYRYTFKKH